MRQTYSSWGNKTYYVVCPRTRTGRKNGQCWTKGKGKVPASKLERSQSRNNDMMHLWMRFCGHHAVLFWLACLAGELACCSGPVSPGEKEEGKEGVREGGKEGEVLLTFNYRPSPERRGEKIWNKGIARGGYIATHRFVFMKIQEQIVTDKYTKKKGEKKGT